MEGLPNHPDLRRLLELVDDTRELVLPPAPSRAAVPRDELFTIWSVARAEANVAYEAWCSSPGRAAYSAYRAAEDRADAAQDALAALRPALRAA
jgi:hypothetical protein